MGHAEPTSVAAPPAPHAAALRVLRYEPVHSLPVVHFGYWPETLQKWAAQGHIAADDARAWADGNAADAAIGLALGFDFNWASVFHPQTWMRPAFARRVVQELPDGSRHVLNADGVVVVERPGVVSIAAEVEHLLKDRATWEADFRWRFAWDERRVTEARVRTGDRMTAWGAGGAEFLRTGQRDYLYGLFGGSLFGTIRNLLGVEGAAYLLVDDEPLFDEIVATVADLCYRTTAFALASGARFDFLHFWEDICFKNGPLIAPAVFAAKIGPHYRRITELARARGIDIVSVDCDGMIDALLPTWIGNGVNTMFPIEVGTWGASIAPWRARYGRELRGVGGMNKVVFARDRAAVDAEVERLRPLVELGGYIPCPDHRIAPDAEWDLVRYYCERMRATFG